VQQTRCVDVSLDVCIRKTFSERGHVDLTEENDTFTHMISHDDLSSGEWPRELMFSNY
jgi:hypothetical protein